MQDEMQDEKTEQVKAFMSKVGCPHKERLTHMPRCNTSSDLLGRSSEIISDLAAAAQTIFELVNADQRMMRMHLIAEEFSELLHAMAEYDEIEVLDALADLMYVVIGTAIQFDLPLDAAFVEVHLANMSKHTALSSASNHTGDRGKGPDYRPPQLERLLAERDGAS